MSPDGALTEQVTIEVHLRTEGPLADLAADVREGLSRPFKELPAKYLYDERGSQLFEEITRLPEYYPTRAERSILESHADALVAAANCDALIELGSGSAAKTRLLLDAFSRAGSLRRYVPQDVSEAALRQAMDALAAEYPKLELHGVVGDFTSHLDRLPRGDRRMVAFLGGTIGNLLPGERAAFLHQLRSVLQPGEQLLLGTGLVIEEDVLVRAYDDSAGVTADFNRNVLRVLNRELRADFPVEAFAHRAWWNAEQEWIEMRLVAERAMTVTIAELDLQVQFAAGEELRTEISAKFRPSGMRAMLTDADFTVTRVWTDPRDRFALTLATAT